jgi:DNA-binding transcriptional ArsR family regulator
MSDGPHIARIAGLIGDPARAEMLTALMGGQALTATELAQVAGITKQTASAHLGKLLEARLVAQEPQGRHRYYRLADDDVARLLESLMGVASRAGVLRLRAGPREAALREARVCYDHLAGEQGVRLLDGLMRRGYMAAAPSPAGLAVSPAGLAFFSSLGIDVASLAAGRRPLGRHCLDWSVRRHHLGGALGAALLQRAFALGWARRATASRAVSITPAGVVALRERFFATA